MDGPLRTTRQGFGGGSYHRGGRHRGGRGRHRGRHRTPWRGGRHNRRQPQEPKNRTNISNATPTSSNNTLENQVRCMITKMTLSSNNIRSDMKQNIKDLSSLLIDQQDTFFHNEDIKIHEYIIDCVCNLPNYQEAYAAFTISLERSKSDDFDINIISKCVENACKRFINDLSILHKDSARHYVRCKFILRYLAYLSHAGVIESFNDLIQYLTSSAVECKGSSQCIILSLLVMDTIPYILHSLSKDELSLLVQSLESNLSYKSGYKPTHGICSILLAQEIDEEDDEDEDEEPCSDTLQDLLRNLKTLLNDNYEDFLPISSDMLWMDMFEDNTPLNAIPLPFDSITIDKAQHCSNPFNGIIYGRFPIFSASEEEDNQDNPYVEHYTTLDKFFLHSSVRDICLCYKPQISDSGSTTGDISDVMEQIQSLKECFTENKQVGIDYGIIECLFGLLLQQDFIYVARLLLQYVKSSPMTIPQIVVSAISTILEDLLSSMSPCASHTLSAWLGFHLVNTDFQWPEALWAYWMQNYVNDTTSYIHTIFVKNTIHFMIQYSDYDTVQGHFKDIPTDFIQIDLILEENETEKELCNKMINLKEDSANVATWLCSLDKPSSFDAKNWRSKLVLSTILQKSSNNPILKLSEVQSTLERYVPLLNIMMEKDSEEGQEDALISPQLTILQTLYQSFGSSGEYYNPSIQSLLTTLQVNKLITSHALITFVLDDNAGCAFYWWIIIHRFLQVQLEEQTQDSDAMEITIDKKKVASESIQTITKGLVQSLQKGYNKNGYKLVSKLEGMKYVIRQYQMDVCQYAMECGNDELLDSTSVGAIIDGLQLDNGILKGFVDCLKDGRDTGYAW